MAHPQFNAMPLHFMLLFCALFFTAQSSSMSRSLPTGDESHWTDWLQYIQNTSTQIFSDDKSSSLPLYKGFAQDSCLSTPVNVTVNGTSVTWRRLFVASNGSRNFSTIQAAIDSVPKHNQVPTLICIAAGEYREKVLVPKTKDFITFIGVGENSEDEIVVVWNDTAATISPQTNRPLRTFNSHTVAINAKFFVAQNMVFKNDAPPPARGEIGGQAVALRITGDYGAFYNCKFLGHQDTLYDQKGRHYFKSCFIQGSVDFIFGNGRSLYKECYVRALAIGYPSVGSVTAQKRGASKFDSGFAFLQCNLTGDGNVYLGRAWGEDSRVVFAYTWMDDVVAPQGWNDWGIPSRERTVFYAEFECSGPGANNSTRVPWARQLTPEEAQPFLGVGFINGETWLQEMGK